MTITENDHASTNHVDEPLTVALVTGGTRGLGLETVRRLAGLGWTVLVGARDSERGRKVVQDLSGTGDVRLLEIDVTSQDSVDAAAIWVEQQFGRLDVLVNNAGVGGPRKSVEDTMASDFLAAYGVNVLGPVRVTQAFVPLLRAAEQPRVVMVSSGMGSFSLTSDAERIESSLVGLVYASSKSALTMLTTQYAKGLKGIQVNAADPGYTATDLNGHRGTQSVTEGTDAIIALATLPADGPTGGFFDRHGPVAW